MGRRRMLWVLDKEWEGFQARHWHLGIPSLVSPLSACGIDGKRCQ